ncbi:MAG TPA: cell envelope integrity protein TolA [Burkholderiales bacterium]|nr:cell envelope integrity protein TolA [Burkholderiales bacterium]
MTQHPEPGRLASGVLAVGVHLVFIALLVLGISWQRRPPEPMVAELWREIPRKAEPVVRPPEPPPPPPPPRVEPAPPPPEPAAAPAAEPAPPPPAPQRAEIELKEAQRKLRLQELQRRKEEARREALARRQEELRKKEEARKEALARRQEELRQKEEARRQAEAQRREQLALLEEQKRQAEARRQEQEQQLAEARRQEERKLEQESEARRAAILEEQQKLAQEARLRAEEQARKRAAAEAAAARQRQLEQFIAGIKQKIRSRVVLPPGMSGNPEAVYSVTLLPGGDVLDVRLVKSSGVPAYDDAVERAIHAAEPLPVPGDPDLFQQLREAKYKFRPTE